ncbi:TPA: hypothetical protein DEG21_01405 [Patescibacteria group bacterium]|nr:hypothetical protein [Candidatus Gracilibacteria bacterium]HBY74550.1 hypothetical protein [Candidatus Gracilibacteria bacterium]
MSGKSNRYFNSQFIEYFHSIFSTFSLINLKKSSLKFSTIISFEISFSSLVSQFSSTFSSLGSVSFFSGFSFIISVSPTLYHLFSNICFKIFIASSLFGIVEVNSYQISLHNLPNIETSKRPL